MHHPIISRSLATCFAALLSTACIGEIVGPPATGDSSEQLVVLEGDSLETELQNSPSRLADAPFMRIGIIWDAEQAGALEVATSIDGSTWSSWETPTVLHTELEETGSFVGEIALEEPAMFYRLRAASGLVPNYARLELLSDTLADSMEDGDDPIEEQGALYARTMGTVSVNTRSDWGSRATRCSKSIVSPYRMAIHHTAGPTNDSISPAARMRQIQRYHMDVRGWCDIGYHYIVSRDGRLWEARPDNLHGAHAGGSNNRGNLGISVMGNYMNVNANSAQTEAIAGLVAALGTQNNIAITSSKVKGHRGYKATSCPGDRLNNQLGAIRSRAGELQNGGGNACESVGGMCHDIQTTTCGGEVRTGLCPGDSNNLCCVEPMPADDVTVRGVIYAGANTSARLAGVSVSLGSQTTTTSASGMYQFENVDAGSFTVTASHAGYANKSITRSTVSGVTWASFGMSEAEAIGTSTLQGVVYTGTNSANRVANATITLSNGTSVTTDGSGFYRIANLPEGTMTITASSGGSSRTVTRSLSNGEVTWGSIGL